jgi:2-dehydropantoate 2-reductase
MRFVIYGAGAIGGLIGGRLFEAGHDVTLVARGAHEQALRDRGLRLAAADGVRTLRVPVVGDPADAGLGDGDVVVLAMKSQDTAAAVAALTRHAPPGIAVACAQNGVENERMALRWFGDVYGIHVMCPASHLEPGAVVAHSSPVTGILDLGRYPSGVDGTAEAMAAALREATFSSDAVGDIMRWKYRKLILNLGNAVDAVCGALGGSGGFDMTDEAIGELIRRVTAEGEACLAAAGIDVASVAEDRERRGDLLNRRVVDGAEHSGSSSWQSLARGTGTVESDYLNGEIVLLGRLHGVPTPANDLLRRLAGSMAAAGRPPGSMPASEVLAQLDAELSARPE